MPTLSYGQTAAADALAEKVGYYYRRWGYHPYGYYHWPYWYRPYGYYGWYGWYGRALLASRHGSKAGPASALDGPVAFHFTFEPLCITVWLRGHRGYDSLATRAVDACGKRVT
jgi:hypothetical protein